VVVSVMVVFLSGVAGRKFDEEFAEIGWFDLREAPGTIFSGVTPRIRARADKAARRRLAVAEIQKFKGYDLINDARQLAARFAAFALQLPCRDVKVVNNPFQNSSEANVHAARVLKLIQPRKHLSGMCAVGGAYISSAGAFRNRFGQLLGVAV